VLERHWRTVVAPYRAKLTRVAACESGGRWHIINPPYSGGLQWVASTWAAAGGRGLAAHASPLEQMYRAVLTMRRRGGWGDWPVCGSR
jgi:hypothetical protein